MTRLATRFGRNRQTISAAPGGFLSESDLRASVPAIFAQHEHPSRSDRYAFVPTVEILRGLESEGFRPTFACQAIPRDEDRFGTTKHMLRFRRADAPTTGEVPEIIGINSHGGETGFQLFGGMFRFICLNGMVCGETFDEVRVRHTGNIVNEVIEGSYKVVESFDRIADSVDRFKTVRLTAPEATAYAEAALRIRFDLDDIKDSPITAERLLQPRRSEDTAPDLNTIFNVVQENAIRGGLHGRRLDANSRIRRVTTREIGGIDQNVKLNRALWQLTERMAELKAA